MFAPGANVLRFISALLFIWATASTFACFILLANQNLGHSLPRASDVSVNSFRSRLSSDIFDSSAFGNVSAADAGLFGISRRTTIESLDKDDEEDEVAFARTWSGGQGKGDRGIKEGHANHRDGFSEPGDDPGQSKSRRRQAAADGEDSGITSGVDEERAFAMQSSKKAEESDEVNELLEGMHKSLVSELTKSSGRSRNKLRSAQPVPLSSCSIFTAPDRKPYDPWASMKWTLSPARCKVQNMAIEELDSRYNFRRGFALGFTEDAEDRTHLLPYLRAAHDTSLQDRQRRVLIDLGANKFESSVQWFLNFYPLDFTEIHVFEERRGLFTLPGKTRASRSLLQSYDDASENFSHEEQDAGNARSTRSRRKQQLTGMRDGSSSRRKRARQQVPMDELAPLDSGLPKHLDTQSRSRPAGAGPWPLPQWALERVTLHEMAAGNFDSRKKVNITRFIIEELRLSRDDAVVVKMDIEFSEWFILEAWLQNPDMPYIVDDLFVKFHYNHYSMKTYGWSVFQEKRTRVVNFLTALRTSGFYAHFWP